MVGPHLLIYWLSDQDNLTLFQENSSLWKQNLKKKIKQHYSKESHQISSHCL